MRPGGFGSYLGDLHRSLAQESGDASTGYVDKH